MATNSRPKNTLAPCSLTRPVKSIATTAPAIALASSSTAPENLKPRPDSVSTPSSRPTQAQAAPIASAYLAPPSKPRIRLRGVSVSPCSWPHAELGAIRRISGGKYEQTIDSTMPQKAARNGV